MIITDPEVIKYVENFEAIKASNSFPDTELSIAEQKILYTITEMFHIDKAFRLYIALLFQDYSKKRMTLKKEEFSASLAKIITFVLYKANNGEE